MSRKHTIKLPVSANIKLMLVVLALAIVAGTLFYSQRLVEELQQAQQRTITLFANTLQSLLNTEQADTQGSELTSDLALEVANTIYFPMIVTDESGEPIAEVRNGKVGYIVKNITIDTLATSEQQKEHLLMLIEEMKTSYAPLPIYSITQQEQQILSGDSMVTVIANDTLLMNFVYFDDSSAIKQLKWLPYVEIVIISMFILIGYIGFSHIKRNEQSNIWVGMAKETAHQLGTPLSSLLGWIELLRMMPENTDQVLEAADEMQRDVERLNTVAQRFSKIGSQTNVKTVEINRVIKNVVSYFQRRLPHLGKKITLILEETHPLYVNVNVELFEWVFENLVRNAADAIDCDEGEIRFRIRSIRNTVIIHIIDNGRGIDPKIRKDIFRPGFSTKKRGWGLGLSLAKRIVEEYHGGKIFIKESSPRGTTFCIRLALSPPPETKPDKQDTRREQVEV